VFSRYSRMLGRIPRWTIFPTNRQQYVAEHSYFVSLYVAEIIEMFTPHWTPTEKYNALRAALVHDIAEARTSDIPGPVKREIKDDAKLSALESRVIESMGFEGWGPREEVKKIIKIADLIDELFYMRAERVSGNLLAADMYDLIEDRLEKAVNNWSLLYAKEIMQYVQYQLNSMASFETVKNDDDLMPNAVQPPPSDCPF
jgi:5'-deoxynucleotidase YfbR-like HD superfamily hydrolase